MRADVLQKDSNAANPRTPRFAFNSVALRYYRRFGQRAEIEQQLLRQWQVKYPREWRTQ